MTACGLEQRLGLLYRFFKCEAKGQLDQRVDFFKGHRAVGTQKTIVADFHEPCGKHMLQKAADKLGSVQADGSIALALGFAIAKEHLAVFNLGNTAVADGYFKHIGGKIL